MVDLRKIATEQRNPRTTHIDELSTLEMVKLINSEDHKVAQAVETVCPQIAKAVDVIAEKLREGGRLIYVGCGTSGRLGILDAVECPPTYSPEPEMVQGLIAGGMPAIYKAVEGAEDDRELGAEDLKGIRFSEKDVLVRPVAALPMCWVRWNTPKSWARRSSASAAAPALRWMKRRILASPPRRARRWSPALPA